MKFGLQNKDYLKAKGIIERYPQVTRVVVFGSRAKGLSEDGSDLDLALIGDIDSDLIAIIRRDFDNSTLQYCVDLVNYSSVDDSLKKEIDSFGLEF